MLGPQKTRREGATTDERGQVSSWLVKLLVSVAIGGFLLLEGGSMVVNRLQAGDIAGQAASEAGIVYENRGNFDRAEDRAADFVVENNGEFVAFEVAQDGESVSVTVRKTATVFLVDRFEVFDDMVTVEVTESAPIRQ